MNIKKIGISLLPILLLVSCSNQQNWNEYVFMGDCIRTENNEFVSPFSTFIGVKYVSDDYSTVQQLDLENTLQNRATELHKQFDRHYYYLENNERVTNIKTINDSYGSGNKIYCSNELYTLLKLGVEMTLVTNRYYDFFIGNIVDFWDNIFAQYNDEKNPQPIEQIDPYFNQDNLDTLNKLVATSLNKEEIENVLTFNDDEQSVIFNAVDDIEIDGIIYDRSSLDSPYRPVITSGGIAKGLASDYIKEALVNKGYIHGFINSGRSSITSLSDTSYIEKGYQTIYLTAQQTSTYSFDLYGNYNLSTSAIDSEGKEYTFIDDSQSTIYRHHIVNPYTGYCSQYHYSVTLISEDFTNGELDALSTAFINFSTEEGFEFLNNLTTSTNKDLTLIYCNQEGDSTHLIASKDMEGKIHLLDNSKNADISYE